MKLRVMIIVLVAGATLGLAAYVGQQAWRGAVRSVSQRHALGVAELRIEWTIARYKKYLDQRPTGTSPETKAELVAAYRKRLTEFRGTEIHPNPEAEGELLELQQRLSSHFARRDDQPPERLAHFQWCDHPDLVHTGWYGGIQEVVRVPNGWRVKITVSPRLESLGRGGIVFTPDTFIENYEYSAAGLRFLGGEKPLVDRGGYRSLLFD